MTLKWFAIISILLSSSVCVFAQEPDKTIPKELVQYVRDAQKAGQSDAQIQQNAVNAGWPTVSVTDAMAYVKSLDKAKDGAPAESGAKTAVAAKTAPAAMGASESATPAGEKPAVAATAPSSAANGAPSSHAAEKGGEAGGTPKPPETSPKAAEGSPKPADASAAAPESAGTIPTKQAANTPEDYEIGAGDVLKITVWHETDASIQSTIVLPTGRISVPLIHEIEVQGMTVPKLEKLLTDRFAAFINSPEVSVTVLAMNSKKIYMTGKIKREGPLSYIYEMTVMQAITEAGGVTDYAKKKNIYVLRTENGKQFKINFDYAAVLKGLHLETNIKLIPGDMIVVP